MQIVRNKKSGFRKSDYMTTYDKRFYLSVDIIYPLVFLIFTGGLAALCLFKLDPWAENWGVPVLNAAFTLGYLILSICLIHSDDYSDARLIGNYFTTSVLMLLLVSSEIMWKYDLFWDGIVSLFTRSFILRMLLPEVLLALGYSIVAGLICRSKDNERGKSSKRAKLYERTESARKYAQSVRSYEASIASNQNTSVNQTGTTPPTAQSHVIKPIVGYKSSFSDTTASSVASEPEKTACNCDACQNGYSDDTDDQDSIAQLHRGFDDDKKREWVEQNTVTFVYYDSRTGEQLRQTPDGTVVNSRGEQVPSSFWD